MVVYMLTHTVNQKMTLVFIDDVIADSISRMNSEVNSAQEQANAYKLIEWCFVLVRKPTVEAAKEFVALTVLTGQVIHQI